MRVRTAGPALWSARAWVDGHLFPSAPAPPKVTARRALLGAGAAGGMVLIELARMWPSHPLNSIWAEDGARWLADSIHRGFFSGLTTPDDGFLQTLSRLVAAPVAALPVAWYAAAMALAGAALVAGCALLVWRASAGHIEDPLIRGMLAALIVLLPVLDVEALDNVTNSIWFLLFAAFWLLLWRPASLPRAVVAACVLFLATISNIGVVVLLPLWLLRLTAVRDRRDAVIVGGFGVGLAIQLGLSWNELNLSGEAGLKQGSLTPHWDWGLVPAYLQRIVGGATLGNEVAGNLWEQLGTAFEFVLGAALLTLAAVPLLMKRCRARWVVLLTIALSVVLFLTTGYRRWESGGSQFLWSTGTFNNHFSRYMIAPALLLLSGLFVALGAPSERDGRALRVGVTLAVSVAAILSFNIGDPGTRGIPTWSQALAASRARCHSQHLTTVDVPVAPQVIPGAFTLPLACDELPDSRSGAVR